VLWTNEPLTQKKTQEDSSNYRLLGSHAIRFAIQARESSANNAESNIDRCEELGSMLVRDGSEVGRALVVKRFAAVISPAELAIGSTLGNPLGEDTVGAAEGTRLESDSTL
jgi:hypothetical protein